MPNSSVRLARYPRVSAPGFRGHPEIPGSSDFACGQFSGKSCVGVCRPTGAIGEARSAAPAGVGGEASGRPRCRQGSTRPCHSGRQRAQVSAPRQRASAARRARRQRPSTPIPRGSAPAADPSRFSPRGSAHAGVIQGLLGQPGARRDRPTRFLKPLPRSHPLPHQGNPRIQV